MTSRKAITLTVSILIFGLCSLANAADAQKMGVSQASKYSLSIKGSEPYLKAIEPLITGIDRNGRIVGGRPANQEEFPWQVALVATVIQDNERAQFCGGTFIAPSWVVTAAHCVDGDTQSEQLQILSGEISLRSTAGKRTDVAKIIVHPKWDPKTSDYDIALLQLKHPIQQPNVKSIPLITQSEEGNLKANEPLVVSGWGAIRDSGPASPILLGADVGLIDNKTCNKPSIYDGMISNQMLCAGKLVGGVDSCQGDSGGPLVYQSAQTKLVGIVSWGSGCAKPNKPGVYTRVAMFTDWVANQMGGQ